MVQLERELEMCKEKLSNLLKQGPNGTFSEQLQQEKEALNVRIKEMKYQ
jgi:hypothetical protein